MNIPSLMAAVRQPAAFTKSTAPMWDDDYISEWMLRAHLDPEEDGASRKLAFIEASVSWLVDYAKLTSGTAVLDLGCGPGLYTERLARRGCAVTGIDFARRSIAYAKTQAAQGGLAIDYIDDNYLTAPFPAVQDLIMMIYCDFGVLAGDEARLLLAKVYRALKPGGYFIFDVFTPERYRGKRLQKNWSAREGGFWRPGPHLCLYQEFDYPAEQVFLDQYIIVEPDERIAVYRNWNRYYTPAAISALAAQAGFRVKELFGDVAGRQLTDDADTLGVVLQKE